MANIQRYIPKGNQKKKRSTLSFPINIPNIRANGNFTDTNFLLSHEIGSLPANCIVNRVTLRVREAVTDGATAISVDSIGITGVPAAITNANAVLTVTVGRTTRGIALATLSGIYIEDAAPLVLTLTGGTSPDAGDFTLFLDITELDLAYPGDYTQDVFGEGAEASLIDG